jgi:hypothetical protein
MGFKPEKPMGYGVLESYGIFSEDNLCRSKNLWDGAEYGPVRDPQAIYRIEMLSAKKNLYR